MLERNKTLPQGRGSSLLPYSPRGEWNFIGHLINEKLPASFLWDYL